MLISEASISAIPVSTLGVAGVVIAADHVVPQPPGTTIRWTATPIGGTAPYEYKWLVYNGSDWDVVSNWSASNILTWRPAFANPRYRVSVYVRSAGSATDVEATTEAAFAIAAASTTLAAAGTASEFPSLQSSPVSTVTLQPDLRSPQPPHTTITWLATATGGGAGRQFKWFLYDGSGWAAASRWSERADFSWTPTTANARYRIAVWARSEGNDRDYFEACAEVEFPITDQI